MTIATIRRPLWMGLTAAALLAGATTVRAALQEEKTEAKKTAPTVVVPFYGNEKCAMSGKAVNPEVFVEKDGQRAYFCCKNCQGKAAADPAAAIASAYPAAKPVGNKTCPVSGKPVEEGTGKSVTFQGRELLLCCPRCEAEYRKSPALQLTKARFPQATVRNSHCPVMGEEADPSVHAVYGDSIILFCCASCIDELKADPEKVVAAAKKDG